MNPFSEDKATWAKGNVSCLSPRRSGGEEMVGVEIQRKRFTFIWGFRKSELEEVSGQVL